MLSSGDLNFLKDKALEGSFANARQKAKVSQNRFLPAKHN